MGRKRRAKVKDKVGLPPGSAVYVGVPREGGVHLRAFAYDSKGMVEHSHPSPAEVRSLVGAGRVVWLDCDGVHDVPLISEVAEQFGIHPLAVEDILNTETRPKVDVFEGNLALLCLDMVSTAGPECEVVLEHVSLLLGPGYVLSFQEGRAGDLFDPVRNRIRTGSGRVRAMGPDYLLHALTDQVVDGYFAVVERLEERIDRLEGEALNQNVKDFPQRVYALKSDLGAVRRAVLPLREAVGRLLKGEVHLISRGVDPYLRDLYDHIMQVLDIVDSDRERLSGVLELHLAVQTHSMNDVMKVLTIVSTVFIPLSWVAGIYGMNFDEIPELHWTFGYPFALGLMFLMASAMLGVFRYRGWL
jgi:magnesium transporter